MKHTRFAGRSLAAMLLAMLLFSPTAVMAEAHFTPGFHEGLHTSEAGCDFNLYLPPDYTATGTTPVIFVGGWTAPRKGDWVQNAVIPFAEKNSCAVFVVAGEEFKWEKLNAYMPDKRQPFLIQEYTKHDRFCSFYVDALSTIPGLHKAIRVAISATAQDPLMWQTVVFHPDEFSGFAFGRTDPMAGPTPKRPAFMARAVFLATRLAWAKSNPGPDKCFRFEFTDDMAKKSFTSDQGKALMTAPGPNLQIGYTEPTQLAADDTSLALQFLLDASALSHPRSTASDKLRAADRVTRELADANNEADPLKKYSTLNEMASLQNLPKPLQDDVMAAWAADIPPAIDAQATDYDRYDFITDLLNDTRVARQPKLAADLHKRLAVLKQDKKVQNEIAAHTAIQKILTSDRDAAADPKIRKPGSISYEESAELCQQVVDKYPGTFGASEAAARLVVIKQKLNK